MPKAKRKMPNEPAFSGVGGEARMPSPASRTLSIARKEVRHILRDWQTLTVVLVMPVMMMFLYGYAINSDARDIPVGVEMPSPAPESRAVMAKLDASLLFQV